MGIHRKHEGAAALAAAEDQRLAEAFRDQERMVILLAGAAALMDVAVTAILGAGDRSTLEIAGLREDALAGFVFHALTPERSEALHHALAHVGDVIREFERGYFANLERGEVAA